MKPDFLKDFDFKLLDDPDFKEDSVREEIILPLLKYLGYSASGQNRIVRSKSLRRCQTITERVILLCDSVGWYSSNPRESHEVAV